MDGDPQTYHAYAEEYYERPVNLDAIVAIYSHQPLTAALITALNPDLSLADLAADREEIGYPG